MEPPAVECYAGGSYPERPRAFTWQGKRLLVAEILVRRRTPEELTFLVRTENDSRFVLDYLQLADLWRVEPAPAEWNDID